VSEPESLTVTQDGGPAREWSTGPLAASDFDLLDDDETTPSSARPDMQRIDAARMASLDPDDGIIL